MNRRRFSQSLSLGAIGALFGPVRGSPSISYRKEWAHENLKGDGIFVEMLEIRSEGRHERVPHGRICRSSTRNARALIKENYKKAGITAPDRQDEEFMVGRAAYAKGVRSSNLTEKPLYSYDNSYDNPGRI